MNSYDKARVFREGVMYGIDSATLRAMAVASTFKRECDPGCEDGARKVVEELTKMRGAFEE